VRHGELLAAISNGVAAVLHHERMWVAADVATALPRAWPSEQADLDVNPYTGRFAGIFYAGESKQIEPGFGLC